RRRLRLGRLVLEEVLVVDDGLLVDLLASHGRLNGAFKPANRSPDLERLYLAGGAAHPGPGMPMVMMSGWIAADTLDKDGVVEPVREPLAHARSVPNPAGML
ncbi:MAG: hypothetical protein ACLQU5_07465, partial [Isosphaeraceae bacterium]